MGKREPMTRAPLLLALIASAALAACDNGEPVVLGPDGRPVEETAENTPVELPPSIVASHVYRCRDNSLVYVDWLSNDTARIKQDRNEVGVAVTKSEAEEDEGAYIAEGQRLTGAPDTQSITVNGKTCRR